jgi:cytochrome P450
MNVNIASSEFKANPYPFYARLRAESPVFEVSLPDKQKVWLITRYDDVAATLKDERFIKNRWNALSKEQAAKQPWIPDMFKPLMRNMLDLDAPDHTRLRALVQKVFIPRRIEEMRERVQTLSDQLLDAVQARGRMDIIRDYAQPVPTTIIAELLGVPVGDRHKFQRWSAALILAGASSWGVVKAIPHVWSFLRYVRRLVRARKADPRDDLLTALAQAKEAGDQLNEDEMLAMIVLLLVAGHETTVNLIGNGTLALLQHPDQLQRLRDDPSLIKAAVEELLRFDSPVESSTERFANEDVTLDGITIRRGEMAFAVIASANRDDRQFVSPDTLDLTREPNRHLSFGLGPHYCIGASLARLEGQIAINTLLRRLPEMHLTAPPASLRWRRGLVLRGLQALPVAFSNRAVK